jgi:hypothetical protein
MSRAIPEADWKIFKELHGVAQERRTEQILAEVAGILADSAKSAVDRYSEIGKLLKERNRDLAGAFGDFRRSTATGQLMLMHAQGWIRAEELARFTAETRTAVGHMKS